MNEREEHGFRDLRGTVGPETPPRGTPSNGRDSRTSAAGTNSSAGSSRSDSGARDGRKTRRGQPRLADQNRNRNLFGPELSEEERTGVCECESQAKETAQTNQIDQPGAGLWRQVRELSGESRDGSPRKPAKLNVEIRDQFFSLFSHSIFFSSRFFYFID